MTASVWRSPDVIALVESATHKIASSSDDRTKILLRKHTVNQVKHNHTHAVYKGCLLKIIFPHEPSNMIKLTILLAALATAMQVEDDQGQESALPAGATADDELQSFETYYALETLAKKPISLMFHDTRRTSSSPL